MEWMGEPAVPGSMSSPKLTTLAFTGVPAPVLGSIVIKPWKCVSPSGGCSVQRSGLAVSGCAVPGQSVDGIAHRADHPDERSGLRINLHQCARLRAWTAWKCVKARAGGTQKNGLAGGKFCAEAWIAIAKIAPARIVVSVANLNSIFISMLLKLGVMLDGRKAVEEHGSLFDRLSALTAGFWSMRRAGYRRRRWIGHP